MIRNLDLELLIKAPKKFKRSEVARNDKSNQILKERRTEMLDFGEHVVLPSVITAQSTLNNANMALSSLYSRP